MLSFENCSKFLEFLFKNLYITQKKKEKYKNNDPEFKKKYKYRIQIKLIISQQSDILKFCLDDLLIFSPEILTKMAISDAQKFVRLLKIVTDKLILQKLKNDYQKRRGYISKNSKKIFFFKKKYFLNCFHYEIWVVPFYFQKTIPLCFLNSFWVGKFILIEGLVLNATQVLFCLKKISYICLYCGSRFNQYVDSNKFKLNLHCKMNSCKFTKSFQNLRLDFSSSLFEKNQEILISNLFMKKLKLQYNQTLKINLRERLVRFCNIGDSITVAGIFLFSDMAKIKKRSEAFLECFFLNKNLSTINAENEKNLIKNEMAQIFNQYKIYQNVSNYLNYFINTSQDFKRILLLSLVGVKLQNFHIKKKINPHINICMFLQNTSRGADVFRLLCLIESRCFYNNGFFTSNLNFFNQVNFSKISTKFDERSKFNIADHGITYIDNIENLKSFQSDFVLHIAKESSALKSTRENFSNLFNKTTIISVFYRNKLKWKIDDRAFRGFDFVFFRAIDLKSDATFQTAACILNRYRLKKFCIQKVKKAKLKIIKILITEAQKNIPDATNCVFDYLIYWYICQKSQKKEQKTPIFFKITSVIKISISLACVQFQNKIRVSDITEAFRLLKTNDNWRSMKMLFELSKEKKIFKNKAYRIVANSIDKNHYSNLSSLKHKKNTQKKNSYKDLIDCIEFYEELNTCNFKKTKI